MRFVRDEYESDPVRSIVPVSETSVDYHGIVEFTAEEWADYQRVKAEYEAWQQKIERAPQVE